MNELYEMMDRRDRLANRMAVQWDLLHESNISKEVRVSVERQYKFDKCERDLLVGEINSRMESFRNEGGEDLGNREISDNLDI